jgi:hypothetical protein
MDMMVAAYLAASLPVALRWACLVISSLLLVEIASLLLLDQILIYNRHPSPQLFVELVFCTVILNRYVFIVELGVRDAVVIVELIHVCREREHFRYMCLLRHNGRLSSGARRSWEWLIEIATPQGANRESLKYCREILKLKLWSCVIEVKWDHRYSNRAQCTYRLLIDLHMALVGGMYKTT